MKRGLLKLLYECSKILVTGGAGFIGSHLVDRLLNEGFEVTVVDSLDTGRLENIIHHQGREEFHFVKGDIRDFNFVKETMKGIDAVFHEAALASVTFQQKIPYSLTTQLHRNSFIRFSNKQPQSQ